MKTTKITKTTKTEKDILAKKRYLAICKYIALTDEIVKLQKKANRALKRVEKLDALGRELSIKQYARFKETRNISEFY